MITIYQNITRIAPQFAICMALDFPILPHLPLIVITVPGTKCFLYVPDRLCNFNNNCTCALNLNIMKLNVKLESSRNYYTFRTLLSSQYWIPFIFTRAYYYYHMIKVCRYIVQCTLPTSSGRTHVQNKLTKARAQIC